MMEPAVKAAILRCAEASKAGEWPFGRVVATLVAAGVESYCADYRSGATTCYLADGESMTVAAPQPAVGIPTLFDAESVRRAIPGAQRDDVRYPEFVRLTRAAGCVGHLVWLAGRRVAHFGRLGESHVERFAA